MNRHDMRALRESMGLSQQKMSKFLRLAPDTVRKYESGVVRPSGHVMLLYEIVRDGKLKPSNGAA